MQSFVKEYVEFSKFFSFDQFNEVQLKCYKHLMKDTRNMVVSAPTSSGKTVIFQLAIIHQLRNGNLKCLYLAPIKSLCHQKTTNWQQKFKFKLKMFQLTSDTTVQQENNNQLQQINLVIATPQKIDAYSRKNLDFLSKINLLLVDQVHMLNFQERGATLQAVISRIMSISSPRIIALSATIPNIKEVAQWLKVSNDLILVFGEQYRPVKIQKVVLGFKSSNNPYTFQKLLNYKLVEVIRTYSCQRGVLVFCQTQKGTQMACQQIISDMKQRQFIDNDQTLLALVQGSKRVTNTTLQIMLPQGVAFHNAGLSLQDRSIVQKLFLQNRIRILCTTSTLAMGINLPARLVVIKSTQCYRGAGKGYQEYTQIEMDQMMGRAGRPPFDNQGTVVIMTQKQNYNRYLNSGKLETLQSHLYGQLNEHINAQISLKTIKCFSDVLKYFKNSFCYIRMKNSPHTYGIKQSLEDHIQKTCLQSINKLNNYHLIKYYPQNQSIVSRMLGINVARNSIQIQTIIKILQEISKIKSERDYLTLLCESQQIKKYRNKLDQRKLLKQLNEKNKYILKSAISNAEKKCYVLVQSQLDGTHIQNWQLRKQSKQMIYFLRRLTFCVKTACNDLKLFWPYFWSHMLNKYFIFKFWDRNEQMIIRQIQQLKQKWKMLSAKGFKNINHIINNLQHIDTICQKNSQFSQNIQKKVNNLKQSVIIKLIKYNQQQKTTQINQCQNQYKEQNEQNLNNEKLINNNQKDTLIIIKYCGYFDQNLKYLTIIVGQSYQLYTIRTIRQQCKQTTIAINSLKNYNIAVIKNNYIGFDQFYQVINGKTIKKIQNIAAFIDVQSDDKLNKGNKNKNIEIHKNQQQQQTICQLKLPSKIIKRQSIDAKQQNLKKQNRKSKSNDWIQCKKIQKDQQSNTSTNPENQNKKIRKTLVSKKNVIKELSRKKYPQQFDSSQDQFTKITMKPGTYIPLNQYKCWKPGFRKFQTVQTKEHNILTVNKNGLLIVQQASSKSKSNIQQMATIKSKQAINWQRYAFNFDSNKITDIKNNEQIQKTKIEERQIILDKQKQRKSNQNAAINYNPYNYFLNLFQK